MTKKIQYTPSLFKSNDRLVRSIHSDYVLSGNRVSPAAYEPTEEDKASGLSVNASILEPISEIIGYYRENYRRFGHTEEAVAYTDLKVDYYNEAAKKASVDIEYDKSDLTWKYKSLEDNGLAASYEHRPVPSFISDFGNKVSSYSHCGVMLVRSVEDHKIKRFSDYLSKKQNCHIEDN